MFSNDVHVTINVSIQILVIVIAKIKGLENMMHSYLFVIVHMHSSFFRGSFAAALRSIVGPEFVSSIPAQNYLKT